MLSVDYARLRKFEIFNNLDLISPGLDRCRLVAHGLLIWIISLVDPLADELMSLRLLRS